MMNDQTSNLEEGTLTQYVEGGTIYEEDVPLGIGELLKDCREKYEIKQKQLAAWTSLSDAEICRIESGVIKKPKINSLIALSPYLGKPLSYLLEICGYSFDMDQEIYYNKRNERINHLQITKDIYSADADLLDALQCINQLDLDEITLLKDMVIVMKNYHKLNIDRLAHDEKTGLVSKIFQTTKEFLTSQLSILAKLLIVMTQ